MPSFRHKPLAKKVEFDEENMGVELYDGRKIIIPLAYFPKLLNANEINRRDYIISGGGIGLHWETLDEDILVDNLLLGIFGSNGRFHQSA